METVKLANLSVVPCVPGPVRMAVGTRDFSCYRLDDGHQAHVLRIGLIILYAQKPNLSNNIFIATRKVQPPTDTSPQRHPYLPRPSVNLHDICHTRTPPSNFTHRDHGNGFHSLHLPPRSAPSRKNKCSISPNPY